MKIGIEHNLFSAMKSKGLEAIKAVYNDERFSFNSQYGTYYTPPLHLAVLFQRADIVKFFLDEGCDIEQQNSSYETILHVSCEKGYTEIVALLIGRGADVNARGLSGETPLYKAIKYGQYEVISMLLKSGADTDKVTEDANEISKDAVGIAGHYRGERIARWLRNAIKVVNIIEKLQEEGDG